MAMAVTLDGTRAHVADGVSGWLILDVSAPSAPTLLGSSSAQGPVDDVAVSAYLAAYAGSGNVLSEVDVSVPLTPVPAASFDPLVRVMRLSASGSYVFTAEDEAGIGIFSLGATDQDTDGMPDAWEQQIVDANLGDSITSIADVLPGDDYDGDGLNNMEEFIAGTLPTDSGSVFAISTTAAAGSQYVLRWYSVSGKHYSVHKSTNLMSGFDALASGIVGEAPINSYTDTVTNASTIYYMIGVRD
jgi:hypothetical protein